MCQGNLVQVLFTLCRHLERSQLTNMWSIVSEYMEQKEQVGALKRNRSLFKWRQLFKMFTWKILCRNRLTLYSAVDRVPVNLTAKSFKKMSLGIRFLKLCLDKNIYLILIHCLEWEENLYVKFQSCEKSRRNSTTTSSKFMRMISFISQTWCGFGSHEYLIEIY